MENRDLKISAERLLVSKKEAAQILGVCVRTIEYLIAGKRLSIRRIGKRVLVPYTSLRRLAGADVPIIEKPISKRENKASARGVGL
jgi:excisionase family DNA binding protein